MELYIRTLGDPNYNGKNIHIENEVGQLLTQIETILFTNKREVMGAPNFGASLEDLIYDFHYNEYELKRVINEQIEDYCPLAEKYKVEVDVIFTRGEVRDIAQLNITVDTQYLVGVTIQ
jgi:outer membrane protein assembly factor BamA